MPYRTPWTNFTAGEWTEQLLGRYDIKKYFNSARVLENFISKPYGGVSKTPGSVFAYEQKNEAGEARVIPYKFNRALTYTLCFEGLREDGGEEVGGYMRVFSNNGIVVTGDPASPYELETPYKEADLRGLHYAQIKDVMYIVHENCPPYKLERNDHDDWEINQVVFSGGPFGPKNTYEDYFITFDKRVGTVNLTASKDLFTANHVGESIRLLDGAVEITAVTDARTASGIITEQISDGRNEQAYGAEVLNGAWTVNSGTMTTNTNTEVEATGAFEIQKTFDVYYERKYFFAFKIEGDVDATDHITVNLDTDDYNPTSGGLIGGDHIRDVFDGEFVSEDEFYFVIDMGEYLGGQLNFDSGNNTWPPDPDKAQLKFKISYGGSGTVTLSEMTFRDVKPGHPAATWDWAEAAFSETRGYPKRVAFFDGRMFLGCTSALPNGFWLSKSDGDLEDFDAWDAELDTSGMFMRLESEMLEEIQWVRPKKDLWLGTDQGVWKVTSSESDAPIAPSTIKASPEATFGGEDVMSIAVENVVMYIARAGEKVREIAYNLEEDSWKSIETSLFAEHLFKESRVKDWAWQQQPYGVLWVIREDGLLCGMTYMREQDVISWWRCPRGVEVESIAAITEYNGYDQIWMTVKREVNGVTRRYVEYMDREYPDQVDWHYVDSGLKYDGEAIGTVSGLDHLIGEMVAVLGDGAVLKPQVVDGDGEISLQGDDGSVTASVIHVGLPYISRLQTQNVEQTMPTGTIQGLHLRMQKVIAKLYKTGYGLQFAMSEEGPWEHVDVRYPDHPMDAPPEPYTGDADVYVQTDYSPDSSIWIRHDEPTQCNVLGLIAEWEEGE